MLRAAPGGGGGGSGRELPAAAAAVCCPLIHLPVPACTHLSCLRSSSASTSVPEACSGNSVDKVRGATAGWARCTFTPCQTCMHCRR